MTGTRTKRRWLTKSRLFTPPQTWQDIAYGVSRVLVLLKHRERNPVEWCSSWPRKASQRVRWKGRLAQSKNISRGRLKPIIGHGLSFSLSCLSDRALNYHWLSFIFIELSLLIHSLWQLLVSFQLTRICQILQLFEGDLFVREKIGKFQGQPLSPQWDIGTNLEHLCEAIQ